jgi:hypothetical protein
MRKGTKVLLIIFGGVVLIVGVSGAMYLKSSSDSQPSAALASSQMQPAQLVPVPKADDAAEQCHDVSWFAAASQRTIEERCGRSAGKEWISVITPTGMSYRLHEKAASVNIGCSDHGDGMMIVLNIVRPTEELRRSVPPVDESMNQPIRAEAVFEGVRTVSLLNSWIVSKGDEDSVTLMAGSGEPVLAYNIINSKRMAVLAPFLNVEFSTAGLDQSMFVSDCLSSNSSGQFEDINNTINANTPVPGVDAGAYTAVPDALYAQLVHDGWPGAVNDPKVTELVNLQSDGKGLPIDSLQSSENTPDNR